MSAPGGVAASGDAAPAPGRAGLLRWRIAALLLAPMTAVMTLDRAAMSIAAPVVQKELGLSLVDMSIILTAYFWTYALGQLPAGRLAELFGPRRVLFSTGIAWSLVMVATPLRATWGWLLGCRALLGAAQSADWSSGIVALRRWFPRGERATGNSILLAGLYLGPIVSAPLTTWVIGRFGWHAMFQAYGVFGVLLALAWWWGFRDDPATHPRITTAEAAYIAAGRAAPHPEPAKRGLWLAGFRMPRFWLFGLQYFLLVLIQSFYSTWLPTYLMKARGLSLQAMGFYASLPWIAVIVAVYVAGSLCDRIQRRTGSIWFARVPVAIVGFLAGAGSTFAAAHAVSIASAIAWLCAAFAAVGFVQVVVWSVTQDLGGEFTGVMSGWTNLWGAAANVAGPVGVAAIVRVTGDWSAALVATAIAAACGSVLWLFLQPQRPLPWRASLAGDATLSPAVAVRSGEAQP
ncbi:MFS transporter [Burkholderia sp. FERM BP-3421]|uniref:MFS transporter n=1 Tax=Burkholderia sp. FERM BP-3421 TaxID=1494466 RepID=UPI00235E8C62|nr:MFS transporter [Burkholderia sp. FERM BP-3421]WDD95765.1 MFS transporter [Burkholderia sp. FERM BP-3421]